MEIIIKIDEEVFKRIQDNDYCGISNADMYNAVKNGIPLPKGHGRIVDITKLEYLQTLNRAIHDEIPWSEAIQKIKDSAPTIIEAESEDKEW